MVFMMHDALFDSVSCINVIHLSVSFVGSASAVWNVIFNCAFDLFIPSSLEKKK